MQIIADVACFESPKSPSRRKRGEATSVKMTYLSSYKVALQYFTHCKNLLNSAITAIDKVQGFFQFKIFTVDNDIDVQAAQMPIPGLSATR